MDKPKMTRPQFLMKFFPDGITDKELRRMFPYHYGRIYCCYNIVTESALPPDDIIAGTVDAEDGTIALQVRKPKFGNVLKEKYHGSEQTVGKESYRIKIKIRGDFILFLAKNVDSPDENEDK